MATPLTPFEELQQYAKTLDPKAPLFDAFWITETGRNLGDDLYFPRSRAVVMVLLPDAIEKVWPCSHLDRRHGITYFLPDCCLSQAHDIGQWHIAPGVSIEATCAVLLAALKTKEVAYAIDALAVTIDPEGHRWIRCVKCVGSGEIANPTSLLLGQQMRSPPIGITRCPECKGTGKVEVPGVPTKAIGG